MSERITVNSKKPVSIKENQFSHRRKTNFRSNSSPVNRILYLQRTIGNQAVQRMVRSGTLQAKLKIGQPGDIYEQEADRVADAVMQMPEPGVQRQVEPEEEEEMLQAKTLSKEITPFVQRQVEPEEEEEEEYLQAKATSGRISEVNSNFESHIQSLKGRGQPLSENDRAFFEPRFGCDFSQVRLHTDTRAAESARAVNAQAFTVGQDVVFGTRQYAPESSTGQRLMAHELTHIVQQQNLNESHLARYIDAWAPGMNQVEEGPDSKGNKLNTQTETAIATGVKICYVPLSVLPDWLPNWAAPANHAFIEFDDGWSAGFTMLEGESKEDARIISPEPRRNDSRKWCFNAERKDSEECRVKPGNEIKSCIQAETGTNPGKYHLIRNNCGDWVKRTFDNCCLKPKTPWHIY